MGVLLPLGIILLLVLINGIFVAASFRLSACVARVWSNWPKKATRPRRWSVT